MPRQDRPAPPWWEPFPLEPGRSARLTLGPLSLVVARREQEWQVAVQRDDTPGKAPLDGGLGLGEEDPSAFEEFQRFVFRSTRPQVQLRPATADRPVVVRPHAPLRLPPGEETTIYVSTPLWLAVYAGDPLHRLCELPVVRPSDTWFGPSTREGELCYDSRTRGRLRVDKDPMAGYRVVTPLRIRNRAEDSMLLERVSLPVANLSLYGTEEGRLWSAQVTMTRQAEQDRAALEIAQSPPAEAGRVELVAEPREKADKRTVIRALSALFG